MSPEEQARTEIDRLLEAAGWIVIDRSQANIHAGRGVAIREFPLAGGHGFADYLLYVDGKAAGVVEAKKTGATLTGVEVQSAKYAQGLPASLYDYDELITRDKASLDIFWLKDESLTDSDNLPPPEVIAQAIVDDLEAALEQFRLIAGDLNGPAAAGGDAAQ